VDYPICHKPNAETSLFCGQCGGALDGANERLRAQVIAIVSQTFKDQELASVSIADKAEERLWRLGKVLAVAASILGVAFALFGITSIRSAREQIDRAVLLASKNVDSAASVGQKNLEEQGRALLTQMQQQAQPTEIELQAMASRAKTTDSELVKVEEVARAEQQRIIYLKQLRDKSPETPIGKINGDAFQVTPYQALGGLGGVYGGGFGGPFGGNPYGAGVNSYVGSGMSMGMTGASNPGGSTTQQSVSLFREGTIGATVGAIQERLSQLDCYSGPINFHFDSATVAAVSKFKEAKTKADQHHPNETPHTKRSSQVNPLLFYDGPTTEDDDPRSGTVGLSTWKELIRDSAQTCD